MQLRMPCAQIIDEIAKCTVYHQEEDIREEWHFK